MERPTRTMDRLYSQPGEQEDATIAVIGAQRSSEESPVDFTETVMLQTPQVHLDPETRENERILPPNAGGPHGGAYKMLRTQVLRRLDQLGATTLGIVSAASGEGKTLTAINLAIAIAADPARTALLIDFDLRRPAVAQRFHYDAQVGIEECLECNRPVRDAMFKVSGYERLTIAAAKGRSEYSSELLSSTRAADVVDEMRSRYANRIVIFDLPPVLQADDALAFARHLQAGLLVIGERRTQRGDVTRTLELLRDLTFVGTVLNASREPTRRYY